jgi:hypothetical protein
VLDRNRNLSKLAIDGVKSMDMEVVMERLKRMPFLMEYSLVYDGVDLIKGVDIDEQIRLEQSCARRKRLFYSLARASKFKFYPKAIINGAIE